MMAISQVSQRPILRRPVSPQFAVTPPRHNQFMAGCDPSDTCEFAVEAGNAGQIHPPVKGHDITAKTTSRSGTPHLDATQTIWAERILRELRRLFMSKMWGVFVADDAAQSFLVKFCEQPEMWMNSYSTPEDLARAVSKFELPNWQRSERVQSGQGAHLVTDPDGGKSPARKGLPFETAHTDRFAARDNTEYEVVEQGTAVAQVRQVLSMLGQEDAWLLSQLLIEGRPSREVSAELNCSDATLRQRSHRARERFRDQYRRLSFGDV